MMSTQYARKLFGVGEGGGNSNSRDMGISSRSSSSSSSSPQPQREHRLISTVETRFYDMARGQQNHIVKSGYR